MRPASRAPTRQRGDADEPLDGSVDGAAAQVCGMVLPQIVRMSALRARADRYLRLRSFL